MLLFTSTHAYARALSAQAAALAAELSAAQQHILQLLQQMQAQEAAADMALGAAQARIVELEEEVLVVRSAADRAGEGGGVGDEGAEEGALAECTELRAQIAVGCRAWMDGWMDE